MPAPKLLAGLPKPLLFGLYGAIGGLIGALLFGELAWRLLKPPEAGPPPQLAVGASASVKVYPGKENKFVVRIARENFVGPVTVKFGKLPPGMTLPTLTIPADKTESEATVAVGAEVPTGTTRVTLDADAEAQGETVTASGSVNVEVVAPPVALAVAVPSTLPVFANGTGKFKASIARRSYDGDVSLEVDPLPPGVSVSPTVIPRGVNEVEITLKAPPGTPVKTTKLTVTATARTSEGETKAVGMTELDVKASPRTPVDVMFVLDVTSSMGGAINGVQNGIRKFADDLKENQIDFRIGLLAFRDLTNREPMELLKFGGEPFTTDVTDFRAQVSRLRADGGGDIPESSLEAIAEACKQPFRKGAMKVLLLITDAPPKVKQVQNAAQTAEEELAGAQRTAEVVKANSIDAVHLVVRSADLATYLPLLKAGRIKGKGGGQDFDLATVATGGGFTTLLNDFGRAVTEAAMAKNTDVKPEVAATPEPPRVPGGTQALKAAEAPPMPTIKGVQASGHFKAGTEGQLTLAIGTWTGAIAALLCLALLSGQHHYLRGQFPPVGQVVAGLGGGLLVGIVGGAAGQGLYMAAPVGSPLGPVFQVFGWALLGALAGVGLSLFIPNLKWVYGLAGGALGGAVGAGGYLAVTAVTTDLVGRIIGGLIVGFCIGLMVALVEAAFRRAWLEVRYGARETITVNLGPEPVKVGGDARACTVWARGAAPLALRYFIRDGQVICDDAVIKRETQVGDGFAKEVGNVTVTVRTGSGTPSAPPVFRPVAAPPLPSKAPSAAAPLSLDDDFDPLPMMVSPPPAPPTPPQFAPSVPVGGSRTEMAPVPPKPAAPPVPPRPAVPVGGSKPTLPPVPPRPAAPVLPTSRSTVPPTPPAATKPAGPRHVDACPTCGRVNAGKPGKRYCVVCDLTY